MIKDKVVFITGGGSGIGLATAKRLLAGGAKVFVLEYARENITRCEQELSHPDLQFYHGDVTSETSVQQAVENCIERFGRLDVLINNAGIGIPTPDLAETPTEAFERMFDINAKGVFLVTREALKVMKRQQSGHILTLISMAGQRANATAPLYCASKFAARGFNMGLGEQVFKLGIKVTDINPGPVDSNYWGDRAVPREKFLKPEDVANVIAFVLSLPEHVMMREVNFDSIHWLAK